MKSRVDFDLWRLPALTVALSIYALLATSCRAEHSRDLFSNAEFIFVLDKSDHHHCTAALADISPEYLLTRVGVSWRDDGQMLDILLEYGRVSEIPQGTWGRVAFIDSANPVREIWNYSHPRSLHAEARIITGFVVMRTGSLRAAEWVIDDKLNLAESEISKTEERVEVRGNQVRVSVPASLLEVSGRSDPRIRDWSWVAFSGSESFRDLCIEAPKETPWPLIRHAIETLYL